MRVLLTGFAGLVLLASGLLTLDRYLPLAMRVPAMAASFASYAVIGYLVAFVLLMLLTPGTKNHRDWVVVGAVVALVGAGFHAWLLAPLYAGDGAGDATDLTVMTSNLEFGAGDASTVVTTATDRKVDVLVLEEVTPAELQRLDEAGLNELLPNVVGVPADTASGTMVFSTYPLQEGAPLSLGHGGLAVTVQAPKPFQLLAVHTRAPVDGVQRWKSDLAAIRARAVSAMKTGPVLVVGDFNATTDHALFRKVLGAGLSDATAQANSGWQPTWPTKYRRSWYRPALPLDHVLTTTQFSAVSTSTVSVPDTDHKALVVKLDRL